MWEEIKLLIIINLGNHKAMEEGIKKEELSVRMTLRKSKNIRLKLGTLMIKINRHMMRNLNEIGDKIAFLFLIKLRYFPLLKIRRSNHKLKIHNITFKKHIKLKDKAQLHFENNKLSCNNNSKLKGL